MQKPPLFDVSLASFLQCIQLLRPSIQAYHQSHRYFPIHVGEQH